MWVDVMTGRAYRDGKEDSDCYTSADGQGCLLVVLIREDGGVLEGTIRTHDLPYRL